MNASEVRHVGGDVSATVIDAAADLASKAQEGAAAAVAGARVVAVIGGMVLVAAYRLLMGRRSAQV